VHGGSPDRDISDDPGVQPRHGERARRALLVLRFLSLVRL